MAHYKCNTSYGYWNTGSYNVQIDKRLALQPYSQAGVNFTEDGGILLISYVTPVLYIDSENWLHCNGYYSNTTIRHMSCFLREYCPNISYQFMKECDRKGLAINIDTLETKPDTFEFPYYGTSIERIG